ncbi:MAG: aminotransferase class V-fold PLP-dependent enzyme [Chloroflexota bacterium]
MVSFLPYYASVHRGAGFKSQVSTLAWEKARRMALAFVGADPSSHTGIFVNNTTEAIRKLAARIPWQPDDVVLITQMEHHSNDLPFRGPVRVDHVRVLPDGRLDEADFDARLASHRGVLPLVTVSGASNVTGFLNPIHCLAEKAHRAGAMILVDCAQLAPHRPINIRPLDDPAHLDFGAFSAHKMYAPFGSGVLVGRRDVFERGAPEMRGDGTVEIVTLDEMLCSAPTEREEAGSPNVVGAVALAATCRELQAIGVDRVAAHEQELTAYALAHLGAIPGIQIFGDRDPQPAGERLGIIPFQVEGMSHFLVAAALSCEYGIGVCNGCFCAQPYVLRLLGLTPAEADRVRADIRRGDRRQMPGFVRASFGLYNTREEVDTLAEALAAIARGELRGTYVQDPHSGDYHPVTWSPDIEGRLERTL